MKPPCMAKRPRLSFLPVRCNHKLRRDSCFHKVNGYPIKTANSKKRTRRDGPKGGEPLPRNHLINAFTVCTKSRVITDLGPRMILSIQQLYPCPWEKVREKNKQAQEKLEGEPKKIQGIVDKEENYTSWALKEVPHYYPSDV